MLVYADDVPEGDTEVNNEDEDNEVTPIPVAVNNAVNVQLYVDYYHHLRNVWINALCIFFCKHVQQELSEELKEIDRRTHAKIEMSSFIRALDACFNQTNNCAKGNGNGF